MRVLVTGSSGFIGSHLIKKLLSDHPEFDILGIDKEPVDLPIRQLALDLSDDSARVEIQKFNPSIVYHLAAQVDVTTSVKKPKFDGMLNYIATANMIEGLMEGTCERIIYTNSGGAIYSQDSTLPITEESEVKPTSPYGVSKFASELLLDAYSSLLNFKLVSLRLSNVYGLGHKGGVVTKFIEAHQNGSSSVIYGSGKSTRDYVYILDVVDALVKSLTTRTSLKLNISSGKEVSLLELVNQLSVVLGSEFKYEMHSSRAGEIQRSCLDPGKAKSELIWNPKFSLASGLENFYREIQVK